MEFRARPEDAGRRIEAFLARRMPQASWSHVQKLLRRERVVVGGRVASRGLLLQGTETVEILPDLDRPVPPPMPNRRIRFRRVHEDEDLAVVDKPAPLAMHPGPGHGTDTFLNALVGRYPELASLGAERGFGLVHRLDRETSGLLVVARSARGYDGLSEAFRRREVEKEYLALVAGRPHPASGAVDAPVEGKDARTQYEVVETAGGVSLVRARPVTGRTHQIRVHLAGLGTPVLGDRRYGEGRDQATAGVFLPRFALHAARLAFRHPASGERMAFELPLPRDLARAWARCQHGGT